MAGILPRSVGKMKISEKIATIVKLAEEKFGVSRHLNDAITVGIYIAPDHTCQVYLARPSKNQLDRGVVEPITCRLWEENIAFFSENHSTLTRALNWLYKQIQEAGSEDFPSGDSKFYVINRDLINSEFGNDVVNK